jgi:crossover junction endodeoxyribonuclease RuvC
MPNFIINMRNYFDLISSTVDSKGPVFIGVDPGAKGAIAWLIEDFIIVSDCPVDKGGRVDHARLHELLQSQNVPFRKRVAYIEHVHAMPGQGLVSMFSLGGNYNSWLQGLACNYIDVKEVSPKSWKYKIGVTADKQTSVDKACELFPSYKHLFTGPKGGLKDGRAEAVLLAYLAQKEWKQNE